jgi:hypothetical protein
VRDLMQTELDGQTAEVLPARELMGRPVGGSVTNGSHNGGTVQTPGAANVSVGNGHFNGGVFIIRLGA